MDNVPGTSGNDQIYGTVSTSSTLNSFDVIDGGVGTDTLHVTLNGASYAADSTIRNIEAINVRASTAHNFNANALTGVTNMTLEGSVAASSFTNVGSAATTIGMRNIADALADLTVIFADAALTATNDTVTVNLNAAGDTANRPDILIRTTGSTNGAETLKVVTSGTASFLGMLESTNNTGSGAANATLKTLTITGDQNLTVETILEFAASTGTVDASTLTGKLNIGLDIGGAVNVTGGTADDTLSFTTGLTVDDTVNGGAGIDTLSVTDLDTLTLASFTKVTSIEVIDQRSTTNFNQVLTTGGATLSKVILRENATDAKNITATDLAAGVAVELVQVGAGAVQMGAVTLGLKDGSGTADALTVTLKGEGAATAANNLADSLVITNIETLNLVSSSTSTTGGVLAAANANTLTTITADTTLASINASGTSALIASVGAAATKLTKFDASTMTGDLALTLAAGDVSVSGGAGDDTFTFGLTLNNKDAVVGGANTASSKEDLLTATVTDLTATTGALTISGVERINLTNAGTAVIDATKITGAAEIGLTVDGTATTISGLASGAKIGLGFKGLNAAGDNAAFGTITATLTDEAGTADSVTFNLNDIDDNDVHAVTLKTTGIETVNLAYSTTAAALAGLTVTSTDLKASTINVSGSDGNTDNVVTMGTLNAATTKLDASTFKGKLIATAATDTATAILANGLVANNITGGGKADTVTIGAATNTLVQTVAGGAGTDTLNITLKDGAQDFTSISAFEVINITVADSAAVAITTSAAGLIDANLTTLTITGGNTLSTFTNTAVAAAVTTALTKIDTSGFKGDASLFFANDALTSVNVITGGASTKDTVNTIISNSANTFKMSGIETLSVANSGGASSINLADSVGLTTFILNEALTTSGTVTLTNYDLATRLTLGVGADAGNATGTDVGVAVVVTATSATGAADTLNVTVQDIDNTTASVQANGVETINLKIAADAAATQTLAVSDTNATNKFVVNVTDGTSAQGFTLGGLTSDATSVNASTFIGNLSFSSTARAGTTAMTITGGVGTDALNMKHANDVIDGGTGSDTLTVVQNAVLGGFLIDLSSTVDQITTYNGSANSAVQKGFESVNLSNITGTFGADVTGTTGINTIVGTSNNDVITGNAGQDTITGGAGSDNITITDSGVAATNSATLIFSTVATNGTDTITGFLAAATAAGGDVLNFAGVSTSATKVFEVVATTGTDITTDANVIVITTAAGIAAAATAIAADTTVTVTNGYIVILDSGNANALTVYHSTDLAGNGVETAIAILTGTTIGNLVTANFVIG